MDLEDVQALLLSQEMHLQSATIVAPLFAHMTDHSKKMDQNNTNSS